MVFFVKWKIAYGKWVYIVSNLVFRCAKTKKFGIWGLAIFHVLIITVSCIGSIMHLLHKKEDYVTKIDGDWLNGKCQIIDTQSKRLCKSAGLKYLLIFLVPIFLPLFESYIIIDAMTKFFALGFYGVIYD